MLVYAQVAKHVFSFVAIVRKKAHMHYTPCPKISDTPGFKHA